MTSPDGWRWPYDADWSRVAGTNECWKYVENLVGFPMILWTSWDDPPAAVLDTGICSLCPGAVCLQARDRSSVETRRAHTGDMAVSWQVPPAYIHGSH